MKTILTPKYYKEFKCIGPDCEDSCCSNGFFIKVNKKDYDFLIYKSKLKDKIKHVFQKTEYLGYYAKINMENGRCSMLTKEDLCSIYTADGPHRMPKTCRDYPRIENKRGGIIGRRLVLSCPEAVRKLFFDERAMEMTQTIECSNQKKNKYTRPLWFHDVRYLVHDILHISDASIEEKLYTLGLTLSELAKHKKEKPEAMSSSILTCRDLITQGYMRGMFSNQLPSSFHQAVLYVLINKSLDQLGQNIYVQRRANMVRSRIAEIMKDPSVQSLSVTQLSELYEPYLSNKLALERYQHYATKRPFIWSNYILYLMWEADFPKTSWLVFLCMSIYLMAYLRSSLILLAHEKELSDDDFVLVVQSFYMSMQNMSFIKNLNEVCAQFNDFFDFKMEEHQFSLTPLLLLKLDEPEGQSDNTEQNLTEKDPQN